MIDIDEAIKTYAHNAEYERMSGNLQGFLGFKLLAEWLKDYKRLLLEQGPKMGSWIAVDGGAICSCCNRLNLVYGKYCKHCGALNESEALDD